jgi:4-hydroxybenzoate polyprenyltransferase
MRPYRNKYLEFLRISRFHIVSIAFMGLLTFGWLFTQKYHWGLAFICALDWFLVNLLNRVVDLPEDQANQIQGTSFVVQYQKEILWGGGIVLALSFPLFYFLVPSITLWRMCYHLLGLSYNWPLFGRRLKEVYPWKNVASATGFLLTVFAYPLSTLSSSVSSSFFSWPFPSASLPSGVVPLTILFTGVYFFLFELSYEVIYDLRDVKGDALAQIPTFPVVHGVSGAVQIIDLLLWSSLAVLGLGYLTGVVPWRIFIMGVAPLLQMIYYKLALSHPQGLTSEDCIFLTWLGTLLLIFYHLWIFFRLPGVS